MTIGSASSRPDRPRPDLIDEDPRTTLVRVLQSEEERNQQRQVDLAEARSALARLQSQSIDSGASQVARVTVEGAPSLVKKLLATTGGVLRNFVMTTHAGAGADPDMESFTREVISAGREQRALYDLALLDDPASIHLIEAYAAVGELQRVSTLVSTEFCIFGSEAVVSAASWGDPGSDYVVIRDPMLIAAFTTLFDLAWDAGHSFPPARAEQAGGNDAPLLDLLGRGLKDEAIARYLGWSLRTVRRRVARLMDDLGAGTRFQLGAEAVRAGRLDPGEPTPSAGATAYPGQLGHRNDSR